MTTEVISTLFLKMDHKITILVGLRRERYYAFMIKVTAVKTLPHYKLWIRFSDGVEGTADLSALVGKGVFNRWQSPGEFEKAKIDPASGAIAWDAEIDLCPDALYLQITGKPVSALFPSGSVKVSNA